MQPTNILPCADWRRTDATLTQPRARPGRHPCASTSRPGSPSRASPPRVCVSATVPRPSKAGDCSTTDALTDATPRARGNASRGVALRVRLRATARTDWRGLAHKWRGTDAELTQKVTQKRGLGMPKWAATSPQKTGFNFSLSDEINQTRWDLWTRNGNDGWITIRLIANRTGRSKSKYSFWLGWNGERFSRVRDQVLLERREPQVAAWLAGQMKTSPSNSDL